MASDPNTALGEDFWSDELDYIQNASLYGFTDFGAAGFGAAAPYFLSAYERSIQLLYVVSRELHKPNTAYEEAFFDRVVGLLDGFYDFLRENVTEFVAHEGFHYKLWKRVDDLSRRPFISLNGNIRTHVLRMAMLLGDYAPPAEQSWENGELRGRKKSLKAFLDFKELEKIPLLDDADFLGLVSKSQILLQEALLGFRMPMVALELGADLFDENKRPTYIDYSCHSDEYLYGLGERPGVLDLKLMLGGKLTPEEEERRKQAKKVTKKRPAPDEIEAPAVKRVRVDGVYTMTLADVDADIEDIYSDASFGNVKQRPPTSRLVTPTTANREVTLTSYRDEFIKRLRRARRTYFSPEAPPETQGERDRLIGQLEDEIQLVREEVEKRSMPAASATKLKEGRIAAHTLKFLRSLHMKLVLSSSPPVPHERLAKALEDRLSDWIIYERIWNAADQKAFDSSRTSSLRKLELRNSILERNANIKAWEVLRERVSVGLPLNPPEPEPTLPSKASEEPIESQGPKGATEDDPIATRPINMIEVKRPGRSVFINEKAERRREERAKARIRNSTIGPPDGGEKDKEEEQYKREDEITAQIAIAFAKGGPPDYADIPRVTNFEILVYMIVLTHWRFVQARGIL